MNLSPLALTLFKNPLGATWGLQLTLPWLGSWFPFHLVIIVIIIIIIIIIPSSGEKIQSGNRIANHVIWKWAPLHYHPVVWGSGGGALDVKICKK